MKEATRTSSLLRVLQHQVVPWVQQYGIDHLIVALPTLKEMQQRGDELPKNVYLSPRPHSGTRVPAKNKRSIVTANWPEDGLHTTTTSVLGFVVEGNVAIPFGDYVLHCKQSHAFLIPPGTPYPDGSHLCIEEGENNTHVKMLSLREWQGGIACWLNCKTHGPRHLLCDASHVLSPKGRLYLQELTEEMLLQPPHYRVVANSLILACLSLLLRNVQQERTFKSLSQDYTFWGSGQTDASERDLPIVRAVEYMKNHLHEKLTIDRISAYVYMSRAHFTRQFQKVVGMTFNEYLKQLRLDAAKVLLRESDLSVQQISHHIGISSNHCILLFRQNLNVTPNQFREQERLKRKTR